MTEHQHPAKFSASVLEAIKTISKRRIRSGEAVLDPFAGVGRIHDLADEMGWKSVGVEIEPEWAGMHPRTKVGDSTKLTSMVWLKKWRTRNGIAAVITSVAYGNRMADHHNAKEKCKPCGGTGKGEDGEECQKCWGVGRRTYRRHTYKHYLNRINPETGEVDDLDPRNTGQMHFREGDCEYKAMHALVWAEVAALKPRWIILNVSDFFSGDDEFLIVDEKTGAQHVEKRPHRMKVTEWHLNRLAMHGYHEVERIDVETPRNGHGENRERRVEAEHVIALRRK